jgi:hypothetical protein
MNRAGAACWQAFDEYMINEYNVQCMHMNIGFDWHGYDFSMPRKT